MPFNTNHQDTMQRAVDALSSVDWFVPTYVGMGFVERLATQINSVAPDQKQNALRFMLSLFYDEKRLSSMLTGLYAKTSHVQDFVPQISQAIECYFFGLNAAAISTILPAIEGIIRAQAKSQQRDIGSGTKRIIDELKKVIEREEMSPNRFEERLLMLVCFKDFFEHKLLMGTQVYTGALELNRHGILHGVFKDFGDPLNFLKLITVLDVLCFIMGLYYGGSAFAPAETETSMELKAYYALLRARSKERPSTEF